ncbi:MAG: hypothetical protein AAGC85_17665 [Bacteroidota bacterium]
MRTHGKAWRFCLFLFPSFTLTQPSFAHFYQEGATSKPSLRKSSNPNSLFTLIQ